MRIIRKWNDHMELDLMALAKEMLSKVWLTVIMAILCGSLFAGYTYEFVEPQYAAQISMYINNTNNPTVISNITSSDISASYMLLQTYATVIKSETILGDIVKLSGTDYTVEQLSQMIEIDAAQNTSILLIRVKCNDPKVAALLANSIAESVSDNLSKIVTGSSVRILDYAKVPDRRTGPSYTKAGALGAAVGVFLSAVLVILLSLRKKADRTENALEKTDILAPGRSGSLPAKGGLFEPHGTIKSDLIYRLPGSQCKKIIITGSIPGIDKSEVVINLTRSRDEDAKVLLIDCDGSFVTGLALVE